MRKYHYILFIFCFVFINLQAVEKTKYIEKNDIPHVMDLLFQMHIDQNQMTPEIIKRSFKNYLNHFDPMQIYLMQKEVDPILNTKDHVLKSEIIKYYTGDYSAYENIDKIIKKSILRSRKLRKQIEKNRRELFKKAKKRKFSQKPNEYAKTTKDIKSRIENDIIDFISIYTEQESIKNNKDRKKLMALYENSMRELENEYLGLNSSRKKSNKKEGEDRFSMRILKALAGLDSHTIIFSQAEASQLRRELEQGLQGIGVVLKPGIHGVVIDELVEDSPAQKSGLIKSKDIIMAIDDKQMDDKSFREVISAMTGEEGTTLNLTLKRHGKESVKVSIKREQIKLTEGRLKTETEPFGKGLLAKFTLNSFYENNGQSSANDLLSSISLLKKDSLPLQGAILDLRNNSGGYLDQAVKTAGLFIRNGIVLVAKYSDGFTKYFRDLDNSVHFDGPLVILTSKVSASAAEIVTQTLKDYGAAIVVGDSKTYGKGSIQYQNVTDQDSEIFFKVTIGKYYTPSGNSTQMKGVPADIIIPTELNDEEIGEELLEFPLKWDKIASSFNDNLSDIPPELKNWYKKHYLPNLEKRDLTWKNMLPTLRKNSERRLSENSNFQLFLQQQIEEKKNRGKVQEEEKEEKNYGINDLQMQEAINVLKDMILIQEEQEKNIAKNFSHTF